MNSKSWMTHRYDTGMYFAQPRCAKGCWYHKVHYAAAWSCFPADHGLWIDHACGTRWSDCIWIQRLFYQLLTAHGAGMVEVCSAVRVLQFCGTSPRATSICARLSICAVFGSVFIGWCSDCEYSCKRHQWGQLSRKPETLGDGNMRLSPKIRLWHHAKH